MEPGNSNNGERHLVWYVLMFGIVNM